MLEFIIKNYLVFIICAVVLLLGLFGYIIDRKKYAKYRKELEDEQKAIDTLRSQPNIQNVATPLPVEEDALTGE